MNKKAISTFWTTTAIENMLDSHFQAGEGSRGNRIQVDIRPRRWWNHNDKRLF